MTNETVVLTDPLVISNTRGRNLSLYEITRFVILLRGFMLKYRKVESDRLENFDRDENRADTVRQNKS